MIFRKRLFADAEQFVLDCFVSGEIVEHQLRLHSTDPLRLEAHWQLELASALTNELLVVDILVQFNEELRSVSA